jgi:hypothetical protein
MRGRTEWVAAGFLRAAVMTVFAVACGAAVLAPTTGCARGRVTPAIRSADPSEKIPGIVRAVRKRDLPKARHMVKDLSSDDPAVRMFAIGGLRRLTGETFGYNYYDHEEVREPAEKKWQEWLAAQEQAK